MAAAPFYRRRGAGVFLGVAAAVALASVPTASPTVAQIGYWIQGDFAAPPPVRPKHRYKYKPGEAERVSKEPFGNIPKGPLLILISVNQQKLHLYSNGTHVADAPVATGVPSHPTPMGVFSVIEKDRYHHSNIYSGAPMPYMQRITWSGVALHEGVGVGRPASHGCIRMPHDFAVRLWVLTKLGARVIIARPELKPEEIADPHLFIHRDEPPAPIGATAAPASAEVVKTAQSLDVKQTSDAAVASMSRAGDAAAGEIVRAEKPTAATGLAPAEQDKSPAKYDSNRRDPRDPSAMSTLATSADTPGSTSATATANSDGAVFEPAPLPPAKPAVLVKAAAAKSGPIAIFISRKDSKVYVRQNFTPLFQAPIIIDHPQRPLGTHVFTAMQYLEDGATMRWNVVSLPAEPPKASRNAQSKFERHAKNKWWRATQANAILDPLPPSTPQQALARIEIPQDAIDRISQLIVPGSSLVVSDHGLGSETGSGTGFIVITR